MHATNVRNLKKNPSLALRKGLNIVGSVRLLDLAERRGLMDIRSCNTT
jgi:hypothetical protein